MVKFSQAVQNSESDKISRTENGMKAFATSDSKVLDLFGKVGSSRAVGGKALSGIFSAALAEDEEKAIRVLLWTRDVRGGAGERKVFRELLQILEAANPALANRIMPKIPFLGRVDDLFAYQDPLNRKDALDMFADGLMAGDGLFAKWAPREKSAKSAIACELRKHMGLTPKQYRKLLAENTKVVETQMCAKDWNFINFSHVPSLASARYQKAFGRNAGEHYAAYIRELQKPQEDRDPKVKINASAVYPYDVVKSLYRGNEAVANAQFDALPDFVGDAKILPMVDVSGSMGVGSGVSGVTCMEIAIGLGLYLSGKCSSDFKNTFLTFTEKSKLQTLNGTLSQRYRQLSRADWGMSTNLHSAFDLVLDTALKYGVSREDMPDTILILSDMQFNSCIKYDDSAMMMIKRKYETAGYTMPNVVFWNLSVSYDNTPVKTNDKGVALVSGFSPAIMASVLGADPEEFTPYNMMLRTIMDDRYTY